MRVQTEQIIFASLIDDVYKNNIFSALISTLNVSLMVNRKQRVSNPFSHFHGFCWLGPVHEIYKRFVAHEFYHTCAWILCRHTGQGLMALQGVSSELAPQINTQTRQQTYVDYTGVKCTPAVHEIATL